MSDETRERLDAEATATARPADPIAEIAAAFEAAEVFDGGDLDDFVGGPIVATGEGADPQPTVSGDRPRHPSDRFGRFDRGLWPAVLYKRLKACAALDQSDTDNAARLIRHFGQDLRVQIQEGGRGDLWVTWTGTHWDATTGNHAARAVAQGVGEMIKLESWMLRLSKERMAKIALVAEVMIKPAIEWTPAERIAVKAASKDIEALAEIRAARRDFGVSSKNGGRIGHMLTQAAPKLLVEATAFNHDPYRFATPSQTVWWEREEDPECPDPDVRRFRWRLRWRRGHDRGDMITSVIPFDYDPAARCPRWDAFLARFQPVAGDRRFVQVASGVGLLGVSPQVLVFHYGDGANGKSVFLEVIMRVLAELASSLPAEAIANDERGGGGLKPSPEIARLFGKRFVRITEIKEGVALQEAFVKRITGSEAFPARNLFEGYFEFRPQFIPHMSGNGYPKISGTDNGIWRRMRLVKWPVQLAPEEQREFEEVVGELMEEGPGILRWLVEGASIFLAEGLVAPPTVLAETATMRAAMDTVGEFVASRLVRTDAEDDVVGAGDLYRAYVEWAEGSMNPVSMTRFGRDLKRFAWIVKDTRSSNRVLYRGLRLRTPFAAHRGDAGWPRDDAGDPGWSHGD